MAWAAWAASVQDSAWEASVQDSAWEAVKSEAHRAAWAQWLESESAQRST
jgi:hypothetical protein